MLRDLLKMMAGVVLVIFIPAMIFVEVSGHYSNTPTWMAPTRVNIQRTQARIYARYPALAETIRQCLATTPQTFPPFVDRGVDVLGRAKRWGNGIVSSSSDDLAKPYENWWQEAQRQNTCVVFRLWPTNGKASGIQVYLDSDPTQVLDTLQSKSKTPPPGT